MWRRHLYEPIGVMKQGKARQSLLHFDFLSCGYSEVVQGHMQKGFFEILYYNNPNVETITNFVEESTILQ